MPDQRLYSDDILTAIGRVLEYTADGETHEQMIAIVKVKWMRGGEEIAERYSFRVPRERPLWARISEELDQ